VTNTPPPKEIKNSPRGVDEIKPPNMMKRKS